MTIEQNIVQILTQCRDEIRANMASKGINASGRTSAAFKVEKVGGGIALYLDRSGRVAPLDTLEIGRPGGNVPKGFYYIIKQWTRDKGMQFARESERQTFAFLTARKIARKGTNRNATPQQVYSEPVKKASKDIRNIVTGILRAEIHKIVKTNF